MIFKTLTFSVLESVGIRPLCQVPPRHKGHLAVRLQLRHLSLECQRSLESLESQRWLFDADGTHALWQEVLKQKPSYNQAGFP